MKNVFFAIAMVLGGNAAFAAASGSVVFDPTNYSQTLITAGQSVKQVTEAITGNMLKLKQLEELIKQGKAIASGDLNAIAGIVGGSQLQTQLRDMQQVKNALSNLNGNIGDLSGRFTYTMQMASKYGLTVQEYQDRQSRLIAKQNAGAALEQQDNARAMKDVEASYQQLQKFQDKTPENASGLMQMLNTQMTLLNRNNTQIMAYMAKSSAKAIDEANEKRAKESAGITDDSLSTANLAQIKKDKFKSIQDGIDARKAQYGY